MDAEAVHVLDRVILVVEDAVQPFVHVRHVIAAIEKIVDVHFPVAILRVTAAFHEFQF